MRTAPLLVLASVVVAPCAMGGCRARPSLSPSSSPAVSHALPDDGMVDIGGGTSLHVHCMGEGSPLVVLDAWGGSDSTNWHAIQPGIGRFTRACAYDRAGLGYSSASPKPHLARQIVDELRRLLGERDESGPVVLVGHGTGGLIAQAYARGFPRSVVGMVLVDTETKDGDVRYYAQFPPGATAKLRHDGFAPPEYLDFDDMLRAMQDLRARPLSFGDRPLVVVNHGKPWADPALGIPADAWAKLETVWFAIEADAASLSSNSLHVVATDASWITEEAPDRVVTAVWDVVSSARTGVPLNRLPATAPPAVSAATTLPSPVRAASVPVDDGLVDIDGGISLHIHCVGRGSPTVVLDNGHGANGGSWSPVLDDIGRLTRTCVYDRAGIGFSSSPAPHPHPIRQMVHELHTLLQRAGVAGPYVLVGHSLAGIDVRLFQLEHPEEVVGMVLVDGTAETMKPAGNADEARARMRNDREGLDYDTWQAGLADMRASSRSLGDMPLVVLTSAGKQPIPPNFTAEQDAEFFRQRRDAHERVAHLSTNSAHVIAERSGHFIMQDAPPLVLASVKQVIEAVRAHGRIDAQALEPLSHDGPLEPRR